MDSEDCRRLKPRFVFPPCAEAAGLPNSGGLREFYKGGQWINLVEQNPKNSCIGKAKSKKVSKCQVAPFTWQVTEIVDFPLCIYIKLMDGCKFYESAFGSKDWKVDRSSANPKIYSFYNIDENEFNRLADLFDAGIYFDR